MSTSTVNPQPSFLKVLGKGQGYLKAGFLGFNKSGKTRTSIELAIGTRRFFGLEGPIAMYDTEGGSEYIATRVRKETGKELVGLASRSLSDLLGMAQECEKSGVSVLIADSMTHPWREVCKSYLDAVNAKRKEKRLPPRHKLEFQDWGIIKDLWSPWTDFYMNSRLHIIVCGRAGFDYDYEENEETGRKDLVKTGVKMKTEGEFGFEPSLLVEMERVQDLAGEHTKILHRATVIGDRFGVMDGATGDDPGFAFFKPHLEMLTPGAHAPVDTAGRTIVGYEGEGDRDWAREKEQRDIFCEEIQGLMIERWPGQTTDEKSAKAAFLEQLFETRSWTKVQGLDSKILKQGFDKARAILRPGTIAVPGDTLIPFGETTEAKAETNLPKDETTVAAEKPKRVRERKAKLEHPEFIAPREAFLLVKLATTHGWTESEFVSALVERKGIAGPDFIPVEKYDEILQFIEAGTDAAPSDEKTVILEGLQCH